MVLDSNVLVAALRSRRGASFQVLNLLRDARFEIAISVPLALEYQKSCCAMRRNWGSPATKRPAWWITVALWPTSKRFIFCGVRRCLTRAMSLSWNWPLLLVAGLSSRTTFGALRMLASSGYR